VANRARASSLLPSGSILQLKLWLKLVSPMVWRRVLMPANCTLRELHGVFQIVMGWEGTHLFQFCLRAARYGSWELSASSPDVTLESLRLRTGARFIYEYDLNIPWRHEVRLEDRLEPVAGQAYPTCIAGHAACPPEDCGGPAGYHVRRDAWRSLDAFEDIHTMADIVEQAVLERRPEVLDDADTRWALEQALARTQVRERWTGVPFSRRTVNARLRRGEHREIMHQQG